MTWILSFGILCGTAIVITWMFLRYFDDDRAKERAESLVNGWVQQSRERLATMERQINTMLTEWREFKEGK